jgi:hypothetical protein
MTDDLPNPPAQEAAEQELAEHLRVTRPVPPVGFRGRLHRHLAAQDPGYGPRPERLRLFVACYIGAGGLLIALVALGVS